MKTLKCNRCEKIVQVPDEYQFKRCPLCRDKDKARNLKNSIIRKEMRKLDRDAKIQTKGLTKLPYFAQNYSSFKRWFEKMFHDKPCSWEDYMKLIGFYRTRQAMEQAKIEICKRKIERSERDIVNEHNYPLESEDCETYRLYRAKNQRSFEENDFCGLHIYKCQICTDWLEWFKLYQEEVSETKEGDISAFDKPIIGANPYETSNEPEKPYDEQVKDVQKSLGFESDFKQSTDKPIEIDIDRKDDFFNDKNQNYRKKKET